MQSKALFSNSVLFLEFMQHVRGNPFHHHIYNQYAGPFRHDIYNQYAGWMTGVGSFLFSDFHFVKYSRGVYCWNCTIAFPYLSCLFYHLGIPGFLCVCFLVDLYLLQYRAYKYLTLIFRQNMNINDLMNIHVYGNKIGTKSSMNMRTNFSGNGAIV